MPACPPCTIRDRPSSIIGGRSGGASRAVHRRVSPQCLPLLPQAYRRRRLAGQPCSSVSRSPAARRQVAGQWQTATRRCRSDRSDISGRRRPSWLAWCWSRSSGRWPPGSAIVARPSAGRWHQHPTPLLGGVAIAAIVIAGGLTIEPFSRVALTLACGALIACLGFADDLRDLKSSTKLVFQIVVAAVFVYAGHRLHWVNSLTIDTLLTLVWIVGDHQRAQPAGQHGWPGRRRRHRRVRVACC